MREGCPGLVFTSNPSSPLQTPRHPFPPTQGRWPRAKLLDVNASPRNGRGRGPQLPASKGDAARGAPFALPAPPRPPRAGSPASPPRARPLSGAVEGLPSPSSECWEAPKHLRCGKEKCSEWGRGRGRGRKQIRTFYANQFAPPLWRLVRVLL